MGYCRYAIAMVNIRITRNIGDMGVKMIGKAWQIQILQWFNRNGNEKERTVVAKANIDRSSNDQVLLRQGSLRMPQASPASVSPLVRYGSLRAPTYSTSVADHSKSLLDTLDKRFNAK